MVWIFKFLLQIIFLIFANSTYVWKHICLWAIFLNNGSKKICIMLKNYRWTFTICVEANLLDLKPNIKFLVATKCLPQIIIMNWMQSNKI